MIAGNKKCEEVGVRQSTLMILFWILHARLQQVSYKQHLVCCFKVLILGGTTVVAYSLQHSTLGLFCIFSMLRKEDLKMDKMRKSFL